jgi:tripartite-type tricarboxylate transporter receptor subunit TctC
MKTTIRVVAVLATLFIAATSHGQTAPGGAPAYPARQVRVIVPYPPGGPTDVIARLISQKMTEALGQTFFVENLPGASGAIGAGTAANAPGDGHTLLVVTNDFAVASVTNSKLPYDPIRNFTPVSIVSASPQVVIAHPSVPAKSVKELVELAQKEPGKLSYGAMSIGFGQLTSEKFFRLGLKVDVIRVPFQGAAPLINSTVGGHTPLGYIGLPPAAPLIKDGKLRALAVVGSRRSPDFPDVPTTTEAGIPGQEADLLIGFVATAGTPKPTVDLLQRQIARIVALPDVKSRLDTLGFTAVASTPEAYAAQIRSDIDTWGKVVKDLGIKVE